MLYRNNKNSTKSSCDLDKYFRFTNIVLQNPGYCDPPHRTRQNMEDNTKYAQYNNEDDILEEFMDFTDRPFMQSTVVPADYDNGFFDPEKGNTTYAITEMSEDMVRTAWADVAVAVKDGKVSPRMILSIIEIAVNAISPIAPGRLLKWKPRGEAMVVGTSDLSTTSLMTNKIAKGLQKKTMTDNDYSLVFGAGEEEDEIEEEPPADSSDIEAKAAGYLCLCLMRLMKKEPDSFMKSIPSIKQKFSLFYGSASSIVLNYEFSKAAVIAISDGLRSNTKLCQTMIYHVATGMQGMQRTAQDYNMMRFTFCQHVELRGLHAYKLFYELDRVFNDRLPTPVFLTWLTNDTTYKAVMQICNIVKNYDNQKKQNEYLWLYARYLNNGYFYDLHTARCRWLVCVLGHLAKSQIPNTNESEGSPLDLMELKKMSKAERTTAEEYAKIFEEHYIKAATSSSKMNRIQRIYQQRKGLAVPKTPGQRERKRQHEDPKDMDTDVGADRAKSPSRPPPSKPSAFVNYRRERSRSPLRKTARLEKAGEDDSSDSDGDPPGDE